MKKAFKIIGIGLLIIIALIGLGATYINSNDLPSYEVQTIDFQADINPESVARGKKIVSMLCASCHMNREKGNLTGTQMLDAPSEFGVIYSQNITNDKTHGIGDWTDSEILYLLRTGIKRDGKYSPPYMAKLPHMADDDINAIISFLRSDDPLVAADPIPDQPSQPSFLTKLLCQVVMKPFPMPTEKIAMPDTTNVIELGEYLAHNLDCFSCHSADFKTNDFLHPEKSPGYFGGGNKPLNLEGKIVLTPNLTPDPETGIGKMTEEQFIRAVRYGLKSGEASLQYPMLPYPALTDLEASAIFKYLKTIPPIKNKVERVVYD